MENKLFFFAIFVSVLLAILIKAWRRDQSKNASRNLPPGPVKLPIIGNMHQFVGTQPHQRLNDWAKKYGPIMHLQLGQLSTVVISSPELAKEVLRTHDVIFASRPYNIAADIVGYNSTDITFSPYGDHWRQLRKICTLELLTKKRVDSFRSIREEQVSYSISSIASYDSKPVNLSKMLTALSYRIVSMITIGKVLEQNDALTSIVQKYTILLGGLSVADLFPFFKPLQVITGMRLKLLKLHREADAIFDGIIREHQQRNKSEIIDTDDLVDILLNLQDRGMLTIQDTKAVILDMFLAGIETSSTTIEWAMSEMVKHPDILEKAQVEIRRVFEGKRKIDEKSLQDLTFLNLVIKEALRLHPPAPLLPRENRVPANICGYEIPEKTQIIVNAWAIGRDPYHWIEPEKFNPERFLNSYVDYNGNDFEFIPFGAGRRMCPGVLFGISIVELVLANLLYHFDWKIPNRVKPEDLDMSEGFGAAIRRRSDLCLIPIPFDPSAFRG